MKALGWIIAAVAVIIVAIGAYVVLNRGALLERAIETYGSRYLDAPVDVGDVNVSLQNASATLNQLVVGNPAGFSGPPALSLDTIGVALNVSQLSGQLISLNQVTIDGAKLAVLVQGTKSNLQALMDNLDARIAASQQAEESGAQSEVKLIIDRLDFTNAQASVSSDLLGQSKVDVPDIHLTDIGRKTNGATVGEVLKQVLGPVVRAVTRRLATQGVDLQGAGKKLEGNLRERANDAVRGGLDRLKGSLQPKPDGQQPREQP